ncbi:MAG TPA: hypothetical protein VHD62_08510 [Opitutaceae bacterium]|nr:hypothetical protein [Opitutaceae bacterium]
MSRKKDPAKENTIPRRKNLLYKIATYAIEPSEKTIEELLNAAWTATTALGGRRQITHEESSSCMVTNYRSQSYGMTFFEVLAFTPGMTAAATQVDWGKTSLDIEDVEVKNDKGQKLQLIENMLHFWGEQESRRYFTFRGDA